MPRAADILTWPIGTGAMATRIQTFDWTQTMLGSVDIWPTSLKAAVQLGLDSDVPIFVWWGPDLLQFHNDAASALLASPDVVPGSPAREILVDAWSVIGPGAARVLETGTPKTLREVPVSARDGDPHAVTTFALSPLRGDDGAVAGVQGISMPSVGVTFEASSTELDERQSFALELSDALRGITDPIDVQAVASRLLGERLQTDRAYYLEINEEEEYLLIERHFVRGDAPSMVGRYALSTFPWVGPTFRCGEPVVIHDAWTTPLIPDPERPAMDDIKVGAFIAVPLVKNGHLVAALCVTNVEPRTWTSADVSLMQATAERTWAAVEQARAEERLRQSEEKYRTLFNSIDEGFCIIEMIFDDEGRPQDYRFLEVNPAFEQHTTMKNATGRTMKEIIPEHESDWFDIYGHIAMTGEPIRFVNEAAGLGDRWFELNAFRIGDPEQRRVAVLFTDITERTLAEASLRASEALFRGFAEASADTLWIVDASTGQLEYLSPAFERTFGEPRDTIMGDLGRWKELVHDDDRPRVAGNIELALAGETFVSEYRVVRPSDGKVRWIRDTGFPIFADDGRVARAAGIAQDVTDQKQAEEEREAFVDAAAHDLKTPLTSLRGQAQLLLRRARREQSVGIEILEPRLVEIDAAASRMVTVIDEMLDAAHLRAERSLDLRLGPTDLVALADATAADVRQSTRRHAIHLETDQESLVGMWDHIRLRRVLGNLLGNAIKYSPDGGDIVVRITCESGENGADHAVLSVADEGIGIPAEDLQRIFQRFRRGGNASRIPGTGIGLAGTKQIVEQHGGTLTVTSEEGYGSVFVVRLPLAPVLSSDAPLDR